MTAEEPSWLTKTETIARVVLPTMTTVVDEHKAAIPKQRRKEKLYLTLLGVLLCLLSYVGKNVWEWPGWIWGTVFFFGANYCAGDYRRLVLRSVMGIINDTTAFITQAAGKVKEIKSALLGLKNGTGT